MAEWQNGCASGFVAGTNQPGEQLSDSESAEQLEAIAVLVRKVAQQQQGSGIELLALLRQLEALHREIRDGLFQSVLPENRQALYALLRDIEAGGGWPYIPRMKLQGFLKKLPPADQEAIAQILEHSFSSGNHSTARSTAEPESLEW